MERVINKVTSARFLIAVGTTAVFCTLAIKGQISGEAFTGITGLVIGYYFNKEHTGTNKE